MTYWKAQVNIAAATGVPEDGITNDFIFMDADDLVVDTGGPLVLTSLLEDFYNSLHGTQVHPLAFYMSRAASRATFGCSVKYFDITGHLNGSAVGSPDFADAFTLGATDVSLPAPLPAEVTAKMTLRAVGWRGQPVDTPAGAPGPAGNVHNRARYTGGVFLGPLSFAAADEADATGHRVRINAAFRNDACKAGAGLAQDAQLAAPAGNYGLCVWSRKDVAARLVEHVQMDDAFDTIRSRGPEASIRTEIPV